MANRLVSPTGKDIFVPSIQPNLGIEAEYRKRLQRLVKDMQSSIVYWLKAVYRTNQPEIASDESPANALNKAVQKLTQQWMRNFSQVAMLSAERFANQSMNAADNSLRKHLRDKGFSVKFNMTREANDVYQATINENVALIKSIASQHLSEVQGLVMRSVTQGRALGKLTDELEERYKLTRKRAAFIARDQNNKATATITRVRQKSLGITQAKWQHSGAGKHPRPSHVKADGELYDVEKGMLIDGEYIFPGELLNCKCVSISVIPGFEN